MFDLSHVSKAYGRGSARIDAVVDVSFSVREGETLGIVGESGSGKSTLSRIAAGLLAADSGEVILLGRSIASLSRRDLRAMRRVVQIVFQDPFSSLDPKQRVGTILEEGLIVHRMGDRTSRAAQVAEMLRRVGLDPSVGSRYPHQFSGGQRQRIAIARALILRCRLLICDEPVSALDVSVQAQILNLLRLLKKELSLTVLFISHDLSVVAHVADRIGVMRSGSLVELGPAKRVFRNPSHAYTRQLLASVPRIRRSR
jgi:oligopeptide transport system ATP-binding protein